MSTLFQLMSTLIHKGKGKGKEKKRKKEQPSVADPDFFTMDGKIQEDDNSEKLEYESLVNYFNEHTKGVFGTVRMPLNEVRKKYMRARIREFGIESFKEMVQIASRSAFLKGENKRSFKATFDWMIKPSNYQKIIEGNYEDNRNQENGANKITYATVAERIRSESDALKQELAAKYNAG